VAILYAGANGFLDKWPVESIDDYEKQMLEFLESKHSDILSDIKEKNDITDETDERLKKALGEFQDIFHPAV
jgi:F-type H+-transporting ATPase subunit alpha